ncbi:hypothetical protein WA158_003763 [Blastocystis sp. Blastoise]
MSGILFSWIGNPIKIGDESHYDAFIMEDAIYYIGDCISMNGGPNTKDLTGDYVSSWIAEIESMWQIGNENYVECRWYYANNDVIKNKRPEYKPRELYETNHINDNLISSIWKKVNVVSSRQYDIFMNDYNHKKENNEEIVNELFYKELFYCDRFFDITVKTFRPIQKEAYDFKSKRVILYSHHRKIETSYIPPRPSPVPRQKKVEGNTTQSTSNTTNAAPKVMLTSIVSLRRSKGKKRLAKTGLIGIENVSIADSYVEGSIDIKVGSDGTILSEYLPEMKRKKRRRVIEGEEEEDGDEEDGENKVEKKKRTEKKRGKKDKENINKEKTEDDEEDNDDEIKQSKEEDDINSISENNLTGAENKEDISSSEDEDEDEEELTPIQIAINNLQLSSIPEDLPCRDEEKTSINNYLEQAILKGGNASSLYISGMPGTGKTATVREVVRHLQERVYSGNLKRFVFIDINGMKMTDPQQVFSIIYKELYHSYLHPAKALSILNDRFCADSDVNKHGSTEKSDILPIVILVDELDYICNKAQNIIYQLFEWPSHPFSHLTVIGISNTMDLPERVLNPRNWSRLSLERYNFKPYNREQIYDILLKRLNLLDIYNSEALDLCARKVAAISGDIRRALALTRRALEIVKEKNLPKLTMTEIMEASSEHIDNYKIQLVQSCSIYMKLVLIAIVKHMTLCGVEYATNQAIMNRLEVICRDYKKIPSLSLPEYIYILNKLQQYELVSIMNKSLKSDTVVSLLITVDDIQYALKDEQDIMALIT